MRRFFYGVNGYDVIGSSFNSGQHGSFYSSFESSFYGDIFSSGQHGSFDSDNFRCYIKFQQWWGVELPDGKLQEITDEFTKETGIKIELLSNPYADTKTQIAAGAAAGTMADVVGLDGSWVYDFAKQGSISNLTDLMKADGYDDTQLSSQIKYEGNTYMIPVVNFAYPMYCNMDILKAAGIDKAPTTWDEFTADCKTIVSSQSGVAGYAIPLSTESPSGIQNNFMSWLWASGGSMLKDGKPNLTGNQDMIDTVNFVKGLYDNGLMSEGSYSMKEADMVEEFTNGRVAFMIDSLAHMTTIKKEAPDLNYEFIPVPTKTGSPARAEWMLLTGASALLPTATHQAEAMKFIEYMMSPEVNANLAVLANAFPGNSKANPDYSAADSKFTDAYKIYQSDTAINEFTGLPTSEDLMRSYDEQLQLYLDGDTKTVDEMLQAVQDAWTPAFA
ncbi:MAG: sugar ABC transporter substrate-binding protein [Lachnospiraceae bacterium]|jgi:multiple sugar transport system substrate-binding protein|nr:sugar ABC transporter substrate-binding protein [Lachnospiraceae bacterium]